MAPEEEELDPEEEPLEEGGVESDDSVETCCCRPLDEGDCVVVVATVVAAEIEEACSSASVPFSCCNSSAEARENRFRGNDRPPIGVEREKDLACDCRLLVGATTFEAAKGEEKRSDLRCTGCTWRWRRAGAVRQAAHCREALLAIRRAGWAQLVGGRAGRVASLLREEGSMIDLLTAHKGKLADPMVLLRLLVEA